MKSILLLLLFVWISAGVGRILLNKLSVLASYRFEMAIYGTAFGMLLAAYGVFFIGIIGGLSFWPVTSWWIVLAVAGIKGQWLLVQDIRDAFANRSPDSLQNFDRVVVIGCLLVILFSAFAAIVACFRPPGGHEWDAIAYHLADVKIFLADHRITSLPTEHHSNFPFTMEMLFAVGLLYDGYPLANLFHFAMAALTICALIASGTRLFGKTTGWLAAMLFVTTPLVLWEASTAYIDLGFGLYSFLAANEKDSRLSEVYFHLGTTEIRHAERWDDQPLSRIGKRRCEALFFVSEIFSSGCLTCNSPQQDCGELQVKLPPAKSGGYLIYFTFLRIMEPTVICTATNSN